MQVYTHAFRPLVYLLSAQHESTQSVKLLCEAAQWVARNFFGADLTPTLGILDRSAGLMAGMQEVFGQAETFFFLTCYPHIARTYAYIIRL